MLALFYGRLAQAVTTRTFLNNGVEEEYWESIFTLSF